MADVFLVVCSWRQAKENVSDIRHHGNVLVLQRPSLEALYSPSLSSRPQFYFHETTLGEVKRALDDIRTKQEKSGGEAGMLKESVLQPAKNKRHTKRTKAKKRKGKQV